MICARTLTSRSISTAAVASTPTTKSRNFLTLSSLPFRLSFPRRTSMSFTSSSSKIRMSTTSSSQIVEHVVLFKVKEDTEPTKISAMVNGLSSLRTLDSLLHLTVGPIHRLHSPPPLTFTHMLHSRYRTKEDLAAYSAHPDHQGVVKESVLPICEDIMAVDWVSQPDLNGSVLPPPGSAMRLQAMKLKEGKSGEAEVMGVIGGLKEKISGMEQISFGENFSPDRAKGFSICSIGVFCGMSELEKMEGSVEIEKEKVKVRDFIDGLIVVDYVLPNLLAFECMF